MPNVARLETERLLLREPLPGDEEAWAPLLADPDFRRYIPVRRSDEEPVARGLEIRIGERMEELRRLNEAAGRKG